MTELIGHHLAQLNIATLIEPLESPLLADFVAALDPINALADASPGFVWRLQTDQGDATGIRIADDESLIVNLSTWESLDALVAFVFRSGHVDVMRRRRTWFAPMIDAHLALWWVPAGHRPDVAEAEERLEDLRRNGASAPAFTFRAPFEAPESPSCPTG